LRALGAKFVRFRRGFAVSVTLDAARFLEVAPELFAQAPLRCVALDEVVPVLDALLESEWLLRLPELSLAENEIGDERMARVASAPKLQHLRELEAYDCALTDAGAAAIARGLPSLRWLDVSSNQYFTGVVIGPDGVAALARRALGCLRLGGNPV